jgi:hypothetical protein
MGLLKIMKIERIGCCFFYSLALIILGMGLYKYRVEVIDFLSKKYQVAAQYITEKAPDKVDEIKESVK